MGWSTNSLPSPARNKTLLLQPLAASEDCRPKRWVTARWRGTFHRCSIAFRRHASTSRRSPPFKSTFCWRMLLPGVSRFIHIDRVGLLRTRLCRFTSTPAPQRTSDRPIYNRSTRSSATAEIACVRSRSFKAIDVDTNLKPMCDFLFFIILT